MSNLSGYKSAFKDLINEFHEDYPEISEFKIKEILEERLLELYKEYIKKIDIPENLSTKGLRFMRGRIGLIQKSHRFDKKIDTIIKKFNRDRYYLKLKSIQNELKTWENYSNYDNLNSLTNGSLLRYSNNIYLRFDGNKFMDTTIGYKEIRKNQNQFDPGVEQINDGGIKIFDSNLKTDFEFFEDSVKEFEKLDFTKEKEEELKIPINLDLLERIKRKTVKPIEKKITKDLSILALKKELEELDNN